VAPAVLGQESVTEPSLRFPVGDDPQQPSISPGFIGFHFTGRTDAIGSLMCGHHASRDGPAPSGFVVPIHWLDIPFTRAQVEILESRPATSQRPVAKRPIRRLAAATSSGTGTYAYHIRGVQSSVIDNKFSDNALAGAIHETLLSRTASLTSIVDQRRNAQARISDTSHLVVELGILALSTSLEHK